MDHLRLTERIPLYSRGAKGTNIMRPLLTLRRVPAIRFRYDGPDQRGFSFCYATIKSRKQFASRNSHKRGDGRGPFEQFYLTTELSNVVGISHIFVTSFGRYPCLRRYHIFVRKILRPPITELFFLYQYSLWYAHNASAALEYRLSV